ncbi:hypothetical protein MML48_2g00008117 [Holotrichia oblita]|uniref:Uncharacterized protein n=1 Tax=Holotrichia oblita TaxID=644536 RepID=A0ACB9TKC2_HOLOL|nr:hypothetical protein MML48_2g00008117 [Holotrichia oblita]
MSPELNGNPPTVTKRKKNREKKHSSTSVINDCNMPSYNCFQNNLNSFPNLTLQDTTSAYYPFFNCPIPTEPMSLPVYPTHYQTYSYPSNPNLTYSGNVTNKMNFSNILPSLSVESNDYMSLPIVTNDQSECGKRRYSDPGPNDSDSSTNSVENRIIRKLSDQINTLKECNRKLNREINEMRIELNVLKQQQQNSRHFDREYEPGMLAEFIKEVRDAARVREDALIAKVKHMIEEKQLSLVS